MSMPVAAKSRVGLTIVMLLLDAGLATAGGLMLAKGLAKPGSGRSRATRRPTRPDPAPEPAVKKVGARTAAPSVPPGSAGSPIAPTPSVPGAAIGSSGSAADQPAPAIVASGSAIARAIAGSASESSAPPAPPPTKPHKPGVVPPARRPLDPYDDNGALSNEIDLQMTRAHATLDRCYDDASAKAPVHGHVRVAFQVGTRERSCRAHVTVVDNTTASTQLATCLIGTIARWSFAIHPSQTADFMRPFDYP